MSTAADGTIPAAATNLALALANSKKAGGCSPKGILANPGKVTPAPLPPAACRGLGRHTQQYRSPWLAAIGEFPRIASGFSERGRTDLGVRLYITLPAGQTLLTGRRETASHGEDSPQPWERNHHECYEGSPESRTEAPPPLFQ